MNDRFTERLAIAFLGLLAFSAVAGGIVLAWSDKSLPGEIIAIGSAAAGVLGGMFSNVGKTGGPAPVTVVNPAGDPVPTTDVPAKRARGQAGQALLWFIVGGLVIVVLLALAGRLTL